MSTSPAERGQSSIRASEGNSLDNDGNTEGDRGAVIQQTANTALTFSPLNKLLYDDVKMLDRFLAFVEPRELASLAQLDRATNDRLRQYFQRVFVVDKLLSPFFIHHTEFRGVQARTGALISGSAALQLFDRTRYRRADLDIYVEHRGALEVAEYILGREGYTFQPRAWQSSTLRDTIEMALMYPLMYDHYIAAGIATVIDFTRDGHQVQLIVSYRSPMDVILNFHSTCVMNIVTHNVAYSLFPRLTFNERLSRTFTASSTPDDRWAAVRQKYISRGFSFVSALPDDPAQGSIGRWVGDHDTWSVPLTPSLPHLPADCMSINAFQVVFDPLTGTSIDYDFLDGPKLRVGYVAAKSERTTLYAAWQGQATKPRMNNVDESNTLDGPFCDALYTCRLGVATDANFLDDERGSTLRFARGGRTRFG